MTSDCVLETKDAIKIGGETRRASPYLESSQCDFPLWRDHLRDLRRGSLADGGTITSSQGLQGRAGS